MSSATALRPADAEAPAAITEKEAIDVLQNSMYPGAQLASIKMVLDYCKARRLDPFQKPCHIVPMDVKGADGEYTKRDVIMPGIGLYRTDAARTGQYAGKSEPEFGPSKTLKWNGSEIEYPEWCRVTVRRQVGAQVREFTATEFWLENYATAGRNTIAPNRMWTKRPRGQIAKCAEAQALRMAFPEAVGAEPTAEEMEGKTIEGEYTTDRTPAPQIEGPRARSDQNQESAPQQTPGNSASTGDGNPPPPSGPSAGASDRPMTPGQARILRVKMKNAGLTDVDLKAKFGRALGDDDVPPDAGWVSSDFAKVQAWTAEKAGA